MKVVIIGNGPAGITAAKGMKELDAGVEIDVYAQEPYPYYFRPKLPDLLGGIVMPEEIYAYSEEWYRKRDIRVHPGVEVREIDPARREIVLHTAERIPYDKLLLATGGYSFIPPIRGVEKKGVFTLRTIDDALAIREYATACKAAIVIGGGLLGLEAARALMSLKLEVTIVEFFPRLLPRQLDEEGATVLTSKIEEMGMKVQLGGQTEEIEGYDEVEGILLKDGRRIEGDLVLLSAGVRADCRLAREAGIPVDKGVLVDDRMKTGIDDIYAAGDVVQFGDSLWGIIPAAVDQAKVAAATIIGKDDVTYKGTVPYTTLKVVGVDLTSMGIVTPEGEGYREIRKAKAKDGIYKKLVLKEGKIVGAIFLGDRKDVTPVNKLIAAGVNVSSHADDLLTDNLDMRTLVP